MIECQNTILELVRLPSINPTSNECWSKSSEVWVHTSSLFCEYYEEIRQASEIFLLAQLKYTGVWRPPQEPDKIIFLQLSGYATNLHESLPRACCLDGFSSRILVCLQAAKTIKMWSSMTLLFNNFSITLVPTHVTAPVPFRTFWANYECAPCRIHVKLTGKDVGTLKMNCRNNW